MGRDGTGCIQNENPHIEEWWEKDESLLLWLMSLLLLFSNGPPRGVCKLEIIFRWRKLTCVAVVPAGYAPPATLPNPLENNTLMNNIISVGEDTSEGPSICYYCYDYDNYF